MSLGLYTDYDCLDYFSQSVPHGVSTSSPGQTELTANSNGGPPRTTKRAYAGAFFSDARLVNSLFVLVQPYLFVFKVTKKLWVQLFHHNK